MPDDPIVPTRGGFRHGFETIDRLIVDVMLAHTPSGMSEAELRYNRQAYMARRRELAEAWAELILEGAGPVATLLTGARWKKAH